MKDMIIELGRTLVGKDYNLFKVAYEPNGVYFDLGLTFILGLVIGVGVTITCYTIWLYINLRRTRKEAQLARNKAEQEFKTFTIK